MAEKEKISKNKIFFRLLGFMAGVNLLTSIITVFIIYSAIWGILSKKAPDLLEQLDKTLLLILPITLIFFSGIFNFLNASIVSAKIVNPILKLAELMKEVRSGKMDVKADIKTNDEIEFLAETFNEMINKLSEEKQHSIEMAKVLEIRVAARTQELQELTRNLEEQVKKRTKELQERVKELEKFHQLSVGRELKMIELKKEIEKLKSELEKYTNKKPSPA